MSSYFLVNNFYFAFGVIGAIVFLMMAWLSFDAYRLQKSIPTLVRFLGFSFVSLWEVINSFNVSNEVLKYAGFIIFIIGLILIVSSFIQSEKLAVSAIIVIPAFSILSVYFYSVSIILLLTIAFYSYLQYKREYNRTWIPFSIGFVLLSIPYIINIFFTNIDQVSFLYILSLSIELLAFCTLGYWVWQYMRLRIHESFVMIAVGSTFLLATIVTLAFSTILIGRVSTETSNNLLSDVKVLNFAIENIKEESQAKAETISLDKDLITSLDKKDFVSLEKVSENLLEKYKLGFLTITDSEGSVLVRANTPSLRGDTLSGERVFEEAILGNNTVSIEDSKVEGFSIRAGSPILSKDKIIATVVVGTQLDNAFADNLEKFTGLKTFIYSNDLSVASSAISSDGETRLVGERLNNSIVESSVLNNGDIISSNTKIFGVPYYSGYAPLLNNDDKIVGMISVAKPQQDIVNIENATNRLTLITVVIIMLILTFPIYFLSKKYIDSE